MSIPMRTRRIFAKAAGVLALWALVVPGSAQAAISGVVVSGPEGLSPRVAAEVAQLGVGSVRAFIPWNMFEPARGLLNQPAIHSLEEGLASLPPGTTTVLDVVDTPEWESKSSNPTTPPRNPADYAAFIGAMARRLAGRVTAWEIWNEEDAQQWWATGPSPAAYAALLRRAYKAVKAADPHATVVLGGLTGNDYEFLAQLYQHGAKGFFDAVGVHTDILCNKLSPYEYIRNDPRGPYPGYINRWAFLGYRTVHEVMLAHGDDHPIWMTELGWSTYPGVCNGGAWAGKMPGGVSEQQQATFLLQAYHCLAQDPYVQVGIWFSMQDVAPFNEPSDDYGLLDSGLAPRPAFAALSEYGHDGDRLTEPCGDFNGPTIKIGTPTPDARYSGWLPITVSATDPFGVHQISLFDDSHIIRNFTSSPAKTTVSGHMHWFGALKISPGRHVLTVTAVDTKNNTSKISIVIFHRGARHGRRRSHRHH